MSLDLYNCALTRIGCAPLKDLSGNNKQTNLYEKTYEQSLKSVLSMHTWSFAKKRVSLTPNANTPEYGYTYSFDLPSDYLRTANSYRMSERHAVEGKEILADCTPFCFVYVSCQMDETCFPEWFKELVIMKITEKLSYSFTNSSTFKRDYAQEFRAMLAEARHIDSGESYLDNYFEESVFLKSRY